MACANPATVDDLATQPNQVPVEVLKARVATRQNGASAQKTQSRIVEWKRVCIVLVLSWACLKKWWKSRSAGVQYQVQNVASDCEIEVKQ